MTAKRSGDSSVGKAGFGCFVLFLLPFCAVGVFMAVQIFLELAKGSPDWEQLMVSAVFALLFGGVGFGLLASELHELRRSSKIRVGPSPLGGKEVFFPAARNPGMAASLTVFLFIWVGVIWAMHRFEAPFIFPIVFALFGLDPQLSCGIT